MKSEAIDLRDERGVAAVEFALISIVLFMIVFGIVEFGKTYSQYEVFLNAAREGARVGAVRQTQAQIQAAITNAAQGYSISNTPQITVNNSANISDPPCNDQTVGQPLAVSWQQNFSISIPFLPAWHPAITIRGVFECE